MPEWSGSWQHVDSNAIATIMALAMFGIVSILAAYRKIFLKRFAFMSLFLDVRRISLAALQFREQVQNFEI